jgi:hypothetical protein
VAHWDACISLTVDIFKYVVFSPARIVMTGTGDGGLFVAAWAATWHV